MTYEAPKVEDVRPVEAVLTFGSKLHGGGGRRRQGQGSSFS